MKKGQEIWSKASHSILLLCKRLCHLLHYLLSNVHFAIKCILNTAIGKQVKLLTIFSVLWRLFLGEKGLLISGIFFWNILMLSFLHHTAFSYLFTIWDLSLYSEELITMLWSSPSLGTQEKKRKPVNFDLCFPHWNIVQFAALPSVLFSFTLYFFTLKQGKHKGNALQASNSSTCYLKSTMLPLCEDEILSLSLFSINGRT